MIVVKGNVGPKPGPDDSKLQSVGEIGQSGLPIVEDDVMRKVTKSLQEFVNQTDTKTTKEQIKSVLEGQISKLVEDGKIRPPINQTSVKVDTLWQSWSWWKSVKWVWLRYFGFGVREVEKYEFGRKVLESALAELCDAENEEVDERMRNFDETYRPWYYERHPKSVMVSDVCFVPVKPIDYVKCNFVVK